jgi:aryl-alcohol dehydrogenase-like predicted oxidoreductase
LALHPPTVASVIIGARNEPQLRENLAAVGWRLDAQHAAALEKSSAVTAPYPYFPYRRQAAFARLNPPLV